MCPPPDDRDESRRECHLAGVAIMAAPVLPSELHLTGARRTANAGLLATSDVDRCPPAGATVAVTTFRGDLVRGQSMRLGGRGPRSPVLSSDDDPRTVVLATPGAAVRGLQGHSWGRGHA